MAAALSHPRLAIGLTAISRADHELISPRQLRMQRPGLGPHTVQSVAAP